VCVYLCVNQQLFPLSRRLWHLSTSLLLAIAGIPTRFPLCFGQTRAVHLMISPRGFWPCRPQLKSNEVTIKAVYLCMCVCVCVCVCVCINRCVCVCINRRIPSGTTWAGSIANPLDRKTFAIAQITPPIAALVEILRQGASPHRSHPRTERTDRTPDNNPLFVIDPIQDTTNKQEIASFLSLLSTQPRTLKTAI
jgi:hypothetical protein